MTFTNRENLPEPIVQAITRDPYTKGKADFTVTELIQPPRIRALVRRHREEIVEDVADRIWALCGQIGHLILERSGSEHMVERRFFAQVATFTVAGRADLIIQPDCVELTDYKFCSVWSVMEGVKPEWEQQINILRYLASEDVEPVAILKGSIVAIFRDWSKPRAAREKDYPQSQVKVLPVNLWPLHKADEFICQRIAAHIMAEKILPLCSDEERWRSPAKWAVIKKGNKRAYRLFDDEVEAHNVARAQNMSVEYRPGESKRCESYCLAAPFCDQFKQEKNGDHQ